MDLAEIYKMENEEEKISAIYDIFDEATRLDSKAANVEFVTTVKYIEQYLEPGMRILDLGAGTGRYSLYFAKKGYQVEAVELVKKHATTIKQLKTEDMNLTIVQAHAIEYLQSCKDNAFDIILCLGPLYHLTERDDRHKCVIQIKRVCTTDGTMFFAFINNDMVITTQTMYYDPNYLETGNYDRRTFKLRNFPFVFDTVSSARELITKCGLRIDKEIASDGMNELLADKVNALNDAAYRQWLRYHFYICEKPEFLGASNHLLFVCK